MAGMLMLLGVDGDSGKMNFKRRRLHNLKGGLYENGVTTYITTP